MIKRLTSIAVALMIVAAVCACGNGGTDSSGQTPKEEAVSENVSEEQVTGDNNIQGQEPVENGEEIDTNVSNVGEQQEIMFYRPGDVFPIDAVRRELAVFGYDIEVYALPDPPEVTIDWKMVYEKTNEHHKDFSFNPQAIITGAGAK